MKEDVTKDKKILEVLKMIDELEDFNKVDRVKKIKDHFQKKIESIDYSETNINDISEKDIEELEQTVPLDTYLQTVENTHAIQLNHRILNKIHMFLIAVFALIVGYLIAQYIRQPQYPPYEFQPMIKVQKKPQKVMLITKKNINIIKAFTGFKVIHLDKIKVGTFLGILDNHFYISENPQKYHYKPLNKKEQISLLNGKIILDTLAYKQPMYIHKITTPFMLEQIRRDKSITEKFNLKLGNYVAGSLDNNFQKYVVSKSNLEKKYIIIEKYMNVPAEEKNLHF